MNTTKKITLCTWVWLMLLALEPARAFYDPGTQRWLNRDPIAEPGFEILRDRLIVQAAYRSVNTELLDGPNFFRYVANNPVSIIDPEGLRSCISVAFDVYHDCIHGCDRLGKKLCDKCPVPTGDVCLFAVMPVVLACQSSCKYAAAAALGWCVGRRI